MRFAFSIAALIASAAVSSASSVTFWTLDQVQRTVYFTSNADLPQLASVNVSSSRNTTVNFPSGWAGNFYAVPNGQPNVAGMLGEVNFGGWDDLVYFDVSAIVNPNDMNDVKQLFPASSMEPMSGCETFPCNNAYYHPDDLQTKATSEDDLICTLGNGSTGITFKEDE